VKKIPEFFAIHRLNCVMLNRYLDFCIVIIIGSTDSCDLKGAVDRKDNFVVSSRWPHATPSRVNQIQGHPELSWFSVN
jgi:hypothetical protein